MTRIALACLIALCWTAGASAACRDDLVKADQDFSKSRTSRSMPPRTPRRRPSAPPIAGTSPRSGR